MIQRQHRIGQFSRRAPVRCAWMLVLLLFPATAATADEQPLAGTWRGAVELPEYTRFLDLEVHKGQQFWMVSLRYAAAAGQTGIPVRNIDVAPGHISFTALISGAEVDFMGHLVDDHTIEGTTEVFVRRSSRKHLAGGTWRVDRQEPLRFSTDQILHHVRQAMAYDSRQVQAGFQVEEFNRSTGLLESSAGSIRFFGPGLSYVRQNLPSRLPSEGDDGSIAWTILPNAMPAATPQQQSEQIRLLSLVRSFRWLDEQADVQILATSAMRDGDPAVTLFLRYGDAGTGAVIWIDPSTWLPVMAEIEYPAGLYTLHFDDYRQGIGMRYPHRITRIYRNQEVMREITAIRPLPDGMDSGAFAIPSQPFHVRFDHSLPSELDVVKGRGRDGHHYVRALINGEDAGWFLVDTGAAGLWIDSKHADALNLPVHGAIAGGGTLRRTAAFQVGRATLEEVVLYAEDLSNLPAPPRGELAGIVGFPLFAQAVVSIDYRRNRISLFDPADYQLPQGEWQPLEVQLRPMIRASFSGGEGLFKLDTGKTGTVSFYADFIQEHRMLDEKWYDRIRTRTSYGSTVELRERIGWFELGGHRFRRPLADFKLPATINAGSGEAGIIGRGFLRSFTVVFNYPEHRIALLR